ncbi:MAG: hypothetical protein F6K28_42045 [Microcoleus sp. SIO2G3]|nr:hypothetical protein [Microcoleus sp. SIO2G3]
MALKNSYSLSQILSLTFILSSLIGCSLPQETSSSSLNPTTTSAASPVSASPSDTPASSSSSDSTNVKFAKMIGTAADGWLPKVIKSTNLKKGMTPEEVGKAVPGAEKVSEFGFSEVMVKDIPGLQNYEFYFAKDDADKPTKLEAVKLHLDPALNNEQSYQKLIDVLVKKYGAAKPEEIKEQVVTWVGPEFSTVQLTKGLTPFEGYALNVSIPKS